MNDILHKLSTTDGSASSYFMSHMITLRTCNAGTSSVQHIEHSVATGYHSLSLKDSDHLRLGGSVAKFMHETTNINRVPRVSAVCWRSKEGISLCSGKAEYVQLCISLPVVLIIELPD